MHERALFETKESGKFQADQSQTNLTEELNDLRNKIEDISGEKVGLEKDLENARERIKLQALQVRASTIELRINLRKPETLKSLTLHSRIPVI